MARPYLRFPDPRLRAVAERVEEVDGAVRAIWDEMLEAMYAMPGVGLAAPQIGIGLRLAVADASATKDQPVRLANPEIVRLSEETRTGPEGSPNLPGLFEQVTRPAEVEVRFLDELGVATQRTFTGLWATSVQHQIDHLEGRLFFDRLSPLRRRRLLARARKLRRDGS